MAFRTLIALLVALPAIAQEPSPEEIAGLVWTALEGEDRPARRALRELRRARVDRDTVETVLDGAPPRASSESGIRRDRPIAVPGTDAETSYILGIPGGLESGHTYPLWIGIHGTGMRGQHEFGPLWRAARNRKVFVAAPTEAADIHGEGWGYRERERALHLAVLDEVARKHPIDRSRVFVVGHSRGGHASFDLAVRFTDRLAGAVPVIGALPWRDLPLVENLHSLRIHAINGARDQPALVEGAKRALARLSELGYAASFELDEARGHTYFAHHYPKVMEMMKTVRRPVAPKQLRLRLQDVAHGRHYWIRATKLDRDAYERGDPIEIPPDTPKTDAARRKAWAAGIAEKTARVTASWSEDGTVTMTSRGVRRLELFLPSRFAQPDRRYRIVLNGEEYRRAWRPKECSGADLLAFSRDFGTADPAFRFVGRIKIRVPSR